MLDPRIPPTGDWDFSHRIAAQYMYHVSPASNRESIKSRGLTGHEHEQTQSPWEQSLGQPPGNYLYENPESAYNYVRILAEKQHKGVYPGDMRPPPDHPGYDVWRVNVSGQPLTHDPEEMLEVRRKNKQPTPYRDWDFKPLHDPYPISEPRWVSPNHVENHRLELHDHVGADEITDVWADEAAGKAQDHFLPQDALQLHPRLVNPKGTVPPELRHIWGALDNTDL